MSLLSVVEMNNLPSEIIALIATRHLESVKNLRLVNQQIKDISCHLFQTILIHASSVHKKLLESNKEILEIRIAIRNHDIAVGLTCDHWDKFILQSKNAIQQHDDILKKLHHFINC